MGLFNSMVRGFGHTMGAHAAKQVIRGNINNSWRFMGLSTKRQWYICIVWLGSLIWSLRGLYQDYYHGKTQQDFWGVSFCLSLFVVPILMIVIQKVLQGMEVRKARRILENESH